MSKNKLITGVIAIIIVIVVLLAILSNYNSLIDTEEEVSKSYAQIDNQLQRKLDLIPTLVQTVQEYAAYEKEAILTITTSREKLVDAKTAEDAARADAELTTALGKLLVIVENYPDLKANTQYTQLMDELAGTENRIAVARKDYNEQVAMYNKKIKRFPGFIFASMMGLDEKHYFTAEEQ
ncbi:LemA family protein [Lysinibacillus piscis]|uniref:LemA family protein n=1 Tax=Lysinibacillus piscis TaxID=2518931 RepID=A0ABQ5NM88_9BACI|nr:LemA family protein [Lysinibacillus sp. KH24]GLC89423.1 hypothetical protein LYSBPC_25500 [Lysinibacillus sp. KH24]